MNDNLGEVLALVCEGGKRHKLCKLALKGRLLDIVETKSLVADGVVIIQTLLAGPQDQDMSAEDRL